MRWSTILLAAIAVISLLRGSLAGVLFAAALYAVGEFYRGLRRPGRYRAGSANLGGADRQAAFFETTFLVMGHVAKADGRVSEEEIQAARATMHRMQLRPEAVRRAIDLFTEGKQPTAGIDAQLDRFLAACGRQPELIRAFLEIQMDIAISKGQISGAERKLLWRIADRLGVGRVEFAQLEAVLLAQRAFGQARSGAARQDDLEQAYKALGIEPAATDKEVKTAYRRLMNQHHPDKLAASGLPDSMLEVAKEKTREIRAAYEKIRAHRGIR